LSSAGTLSVSDFGWPWHQTQRCWPFSRSCSRTSFLHTVGHGAGACSSPAHGKRSGNDERARADMKPIRSEHEQEIAHDGWRGQPTPLQDKHVEHVVSDSGGVESYRTGRRFALQCGCLKAAGGYCSGCGALVCVDCFGHCERCARPLGGCHTVFVDTPKGIRMRVCRACHDGAVRQSRLRRFGRFLLSPLVTFED
jgi:hypothetical protein